MDQTNQQRLVRYALLSACAALPLAGLGCDSARNRADRRVTDLVNESRVLAMQTDGAKKSYAKLQEAAQAPEASPTSKINVAVLLAQKDYAAGVALLPQIASAEAAAQRLINEIETLGMAIADNNEAIAVLRGTNPAGKEPDQPLKALAGAQTSFTAEIDALGKQVQATQGQIQAKQQQIAKVRKDRDAAAAQAAALVEKSEQLGGQQSVDLYSQGLSARAQATIVGHSLGFLTADLQRLQETLADLKQQQQAVTGGIQVARMQADELNKAWEQTRKLIAERSAASKALDSDPNSGDIQKKAKELAAALAQADALRQQADARFQSAADEYEDALKSASEFQTQDVAQHLDNAKSNAITRAPWEALRQLHTPTGYSLYKARALEARANLYVAQKDLLDTEARMVQSLTPIYKEASLAVPPSLNAPAVDKSRREADALARSLLGKADDILIDVQDRGQSAEKKEAAGKRLGTLYSLYHLTGKEQYLTSARDILKSMLPDAGDEGSSPALTLPMLPAELEEGLLRRSGAIPKTAAAPTTAPAGDGPAKDQ